MTMLKDYVEAFFPREMGTSRCVVVRMLLIGNLSEYKKILFVAEAVGRSRFTDDGIVPRL